MKEAPVRWLNAPPEFAEARSHAPIRPPPGTAMGRLAATKQIVHQERTHQILQHILTKTSNDHDKPRTPTPPHVLGMKRADYIAYLRKTRAFPRTLRRIQGLDNE
jgi:hypothetical protein